MSEPGRKFPEAVAAIERCGFATFNEGSVAADFRALFDPERIPVLAVRHVRVWGLQVDDERELPGHERTAIPDEELWEVQLRARDGTSYSVSSALLRPADA